MVLPTLRAEAAAAQPAPAAASVLAMDEFRDIRPDAGRDLRRGVRVILRGLLAGE